MANFDFNFQPSEGFGFGPNFGGSGNGGISNALSGSGSGLNLPENLGGDTEGFFGPDSLLGKIFSGLGSEGFQSGLAGFGNMAKIYTGLKALGLAKDKFKFQKEAFNRNFQAQATGFNNELKDRWTARSASATARGDSFQGMDEWLSGRTVNPGG